MKKKGFTLVELLAVIVILAVIALIATPIIINVIEEAKKGAFKASAQNALSAVEYYEIDENKIDTTEGLDIKNLKLKNKENFSGKFKINNEGKAELINFTDGTWCANGTIKNLEIKKGCNTSLEPDEKPNLPSYKEYNKYDIVTYMNKNWYVISDSDSTSDKVDLLLAENGGIGGFSYCLSTNRNCLEYGNYEYSNLKVELSNFATKMHGNSSLPSYSILEDLILYDNISYYSMGDKYWVSDYDYDYDSVGDDNVVPKIIYYLENSNPITKKALYYRGQYGDSSIDVSLLPALTIEKDYISNPKITMSSMPDTIFVGESYNVSATANYSPLGGTTSCDINNTKDLSIGTHKIQCYAKDNNGNTNATSKNITVKGYKEYKSGDKFTYNNNTYIVLKNSSATDQRVYAIANRYVTIDGTDYSGSYSRKEVFESYNNGPSIKSIMESKGYYLLSVDDLFTSDGKECTSDMFSHVECYVSLTDKDIEFSPVDTNINYTEFWLDDSNPYVYSAKEVWYDTGDNVYDVIPAEYILKTNIDT